MSQPHVPDPMERHSSFYERSGSAALYGPCECEGVLMVDEIEMKTNPTMPISFRCTECTYGIDVSRGLIDPEFRAKRLLEISNLPESLRDKRYDNKFNSHAIEASEAYLKGSSPPPLFHGATGVGKTHLLVRIGVSLCKAGTVVKYWDLPSLLRQERTLIGDPKDPSYTDRLRPVEAACAVEVLILDDLGAERSTDWTVEQLQTIIDHRYQAGKPTLAATNLAPLEWPDAFGERTTSRLGGSTNMVELVGDDRRLQLTLAG